MDTLLSEFNLNVVFDDETQNRVNTYVSSLPDTAFLAAFKKICIAAQNSDNKDLVVNAVKFHKDNSERLVKCLQDGLTFSPRPN